MKRITVLCTLAACALAFAAADGAATGPATLVVDRDGVECASADFTSIQAAVDTAQPGDLIRVCPDLYTESVTIDKSLTLKADPDAVEAIDCFQPTLGELPADQQAIVDPADDGFSIAFKLAADDVVLEGFVVQGAYVGIDASDRFSGYRIHHNMIRLNTTTASARTSTGSSPNSMTTGSGPTSGTVDRRTLAISSTRASTTTTRLETSKELRPPVPVSGTTSRSITTVPEETKSGLASRTRLAARSSTTRSLRRAATQS
jgi:hypothetical protein